MGANSSRQYTYQQYYNASQKTVQKTGVIEEIDLKALAENDDVCLACEG